MRLFWVTCRACGAAVYQHPRPPDRQWWHGKMVMCEHGIGPRKRVPVSWKQAAGDKPAAPPAMMEIMDLDVRHWCGLYEPAEIGS